VPAAILMDLGFGGDFKIRPDAEAGYQACLAATNKPVMQGNIGAGAGATIGKMAGGKILDEGRDWVGEHQGGKHGSGGGRDCRGECRGRHMESKDGEDCRRRAVRGWERFRDAMAQVMKGNRVLVQPGANTTIGLVATNVAMEKVQIAKVAQMAHDGYARSINPVHTPGDGDTIFALATGTLDAKANHGMIGALAAEAMAQAIVRAVINAETSAGVPGLARLEARLKTKFCRHLKYPTVRSLDNCTKGRAPDRVARRVEPCMV